MQILFALVLGLTAWADVDLKPKIETFREVCRKNRGDSARFLIGPQPVGSVAFLPVRALEATQTRFAFLRIRHALGKTLKEEPDWFAHDQASSLYSLEKRVKVAFYRGKLYIVDGHHRALISTYLGAQTIPAEVIADLSELNTRKFRQTMEARGWAHWRDHRNEEMKPLDLCEMIDDPNFQLARLIIRRVTVSWRGDRLKLERSTGADRPVAVKINGDLPFFENHIADALRRGGVEYDDRRYESEFSKAELREFARILVKSAREKSSPLAHVLLLDRPKDVAKLELEKIIFEHLRNKNCELDLETEPE
jgi:hypothetical protein